MIVALLAIVGRAFAEDKLQVKDFTVGPGCTAKMEIVLTNPDAKYTAFETDIYLPDGLEVVKEDDEYKLETSRTAESHSASVSQKTGYYKLVLSSTMNEELSGTDGTVVTLTVKANANITVGNKTGYLKKIKLARNDNTGVVIDEKEFKTTIVETLIVTAKSYERVYGDDNPVFEYTVTGGELDGIPEITCEATEKSPVGTYDILVKRGTETNYNVSYVKGTLTIAPKTVTSPTITLNQASYTYDGTAKEPTVTVKDGSTTIPDTEYTVSYSDNTNVGTATVTITDNTGGNYTVSGSTTFAIVAADGNLIPPTAKSGLAYSGAAQDLITVGSSTTGTVQYSLDGTEYSTSIPQGTDAKEYTVYYKVVAKAGYKDVAPASFKVTIAKAPLKIKAGTYTRKQGEENPEFTLEYEGFKNDETEEVLTKKPTVTTTATKDSPAGEYPVTVSGAVAANYEITYVDGMLKVVKKKGDVNGDGDVDQKDIDAIVSYLYGDITDDFDEEAADVNGDKTINVADIVEIVKMKK